MTAREKVTLLPLQLSHHAREGQQQRDPGPPTSRPRSEEHFKHIGSKASGRKEKLWEGEGSDGASSEGQDACRVCKKERLQQKKR